MDSMLSQNWYDIKSLYAPVWTIYTDGSTRKNPGPGGCAAIVIRGEERNEITCGRRLTTNIRMEMMACILGLSLTDPGDTATIYSDSEYVVNGMEGGWSHKKNSDLWKRIEELCSVRNVCFEWVRGHAGNEGNERADELAKQAAMGDDLPADVGYEARKSSHNCNYSYPEK